jgi:protein-tyrosine phosphatase
VVPPRVDWGGLHNARDLGGTGGLIAPRALFRSPRPDELDSQGWRQLADSGVRTVVDLRGDDEVAELPLRPAHLRVIRAPVEDQSDAGFMAAWGPLLGTPDYYPEAIRRWPALIAAAIGAVADAPHGGVLVHCAAGRDRTGLIVALLLRLADVSIDDVLDDYEVGVREINVWFRSHVDREPALDDGALAVSVATKRSSLRAFLEGVDVERYLLRADVTPAQITRLRARLVG